MYSCTRGLLSRGRHREKEMNRRRGLAEKCLTLHSDPTLETIRLIEVAHARTQDAVTVVRMAFAEQLRCWLWSTCGGKISARDHAGINTPDKTVYPTLIAIRAFDSNDLRRLRICSIRLSGCFSRNRTRKRPSQIAFPPLTRKNEPIHLFFHDGFWIDFHAASWLFNGCSAA